VSYSRLVITAGFAMFSMFFGSGNLVFPLLIGVATLSEFSYATLGLLLTGVIVPFLGLMAMIYYQGNRHAFFNMLGPRVAFVLTFAMLALMGPFGVLPRCVMVTYGGMQLLFPALEAAVFNGLFLGLTGLLVWQKNKLIEVVGKFLTPGLLLGIIVLILAGYLTEMPFTRCGLDAAGAFVIGLQQGYQTMDLLAAFFFSATVVKYIATHYQSKQGQDKQDFTRLKRLSVGASIIGALLLACVYLGFVYLGAKYAPFLQGVAQEKLLVAVAEKTLGPIALPLASGVIALACLTTAMILTTLFTNFMHQDLFRHKLPRSVALSLTLIIAYIFSLMGFNQLALWIAAALWVIYPALIAYALFAIIERRAKHRMNGKSRAKQAFYLVFLLSLSLRITQYLGVL
jgi:Branched-chain amino acid permeases